jgi:hypothetical protein
MLPAELASPRLSLEATQEAGEAPCSDDSVSSLFSPSLLLPPCRKIADAIMRIQHRRGAQPWGVKKDMSQGKDYLRCWPCCPPSFFHWASAAREAALDLGRSSIGEDTVLRVGKRQRIGEERSGVRTATIPLF